ncbi:MAG: hypothetical protein PHI44_05755, partial [Candidatus Ratteibacteria bacterium]|nr:hypothetical protein [Candidatus Ratteibacteria bacterium]
MLSKELIKVGSKTLKDNKIEEPVRKAEILLSDITKRKIPDLYITEEKVPEEIIKKYTKYLKKLL